MELVQKQIHRNQIGKSVLDQFYMDDDINVPDAKDDIGKIVMGKGSVNVEEMQRMETYVRVSGKLSYAVLYVTDSGDPHLAVLEGKCPFEEMVYVEGGAEDQYVLRSSRVEFSVSLIHSRKISVKAMVEIEIGSERLTDTAFPVEAEGEEALYKKTKEMQVLKLHTNKKDTYRIKEELELPGTKENIGTLLWTDVQNRRLDTKLGEDELNVSGELLVFCLYESPEGKMDWLEQTITYNGRVECSGADIGMFHHVYASLEDVITDVKMDADGEMRSIGIEGTLGLRIAVYEEENVKVLEDVYSIEKECTTERKEAVWEELLIQNHSKCKLAEQLSLPELREDILQICSSSGELQIEKMVVEEQGIRVEGILHLRFLYVKENDEMPFAVWQGMVPFTYVIECGNVAQDALFDMEPVLEQLSVSLLGSQEVEVKAVLAFHSLVKRQKKEEMITSIILNDPVRNENVRTPGIIGYMVKEGDELWNLAKQYHTTVDHVKEVNHLENDEIKEGDRILIFKENMGIL